MERLHKLKALLFKPISIIPLVFFRVSFGLIMLWETTRYFSHNWIERYYIEPHFFFNYEGFSWVQAWSGGGMYYHFYVLGILAFFIAIGCLYRLSAILFFIAFSFVFLLDKSNYLNHFYLIVLLSFIMIFLPANKKYAVDVLIFPKIKSNIAPNWTLLWLKIQLGLVYFFGGVAKLNTDWLFRGEPMRDWLSRKTDFPIIGQFFEQEFMVYFMSYSGLLLDLFIFPFLMIKKTRWWAFGIIVCFHLMNTQLFKIGIFPWFMILATAIFLPFDTLFLTEKDKENTKNFMPSNWIMAGIACYLLVQIALPLRHFFYKGNPNWTEEGHRFAWHMKLRDKESKARFFIVNKATNEKVEVFAKDHLSKRQARKMSGRPDMILQFAHYLRDKALDNGLENFAITSEIMCSLNSRKPQLLIDTTTNLADIEYGIFEKADWILPLEEK